MREIAQDILQLADRHDCRLCSAESVTGGRIAAALTAVSGASQVFFAGGVFYDVRAKTRFLGIPDEFFEDFSVYSAECAARMATEWRERCDADFCIATTGEAEPVDQPYGRVYFAVATRNEVLTDSKGFTGTRNNIQEQAALFALRFLQKVLLDKLRK